MTFAIKIPAAGTCDPFPAGEPVFMLNLLRFRGPGGRAAYLEAYVGAFRTVMAELGVEGVEPFWMGDVTAMMAAPDDERWDAVLIVRYASIDAFRAVVDSDAYRQLAAPHRERALTDWRLVAMRTPPGG